ncbi:AMP-binding protein, partial [Agrobacterium rhizogenes]|nr:AMP-binding protein [Rhizobium rhizogenes]
AYPHTPPATNVRPDNLAYVIYTSGSTGKPKGAMGIHEKVFKLFASTRHWLSYDQDDVWSFFHSFSFDFSVWELWGALLHGGSVVVITAEATKAPDLFFDAIQKHHVTVLSQTPSMFKELEKIDEQRGSGYLRQLRLVIFAGELLSLQGLRGWISRYGDEQPRLINMYGATETTVHATYRRIQTHDLALSATNVVGIP